MAEDRQVAARDLEGEIELANTKLEEAKVNREIALARHAMVQDGLFGLAVVAVVISVVLSIAIGTTSVYLAALERDVEIATLGYEQVIDSDGYVWRRVRELPMKTKE